ncbi:MAG TPA: bifunctional DNA-binding transcriptional regulator/O6-methylguanine-DNA methyltransferase Ada [Methylocella sp.]|nr:bifunctional DNA-binding transcriptional regulator/O6-methylguanine-DNA methyltransferase Ada [Methylocella sp.]
MPSKAKINETTADADPRWKSLKLRDPACDGRFYYAVKTTGVYCRPSCPARTAKLENIGFYASREEAERAGFRPCKRCKPNQPSLAARQVVLVAEICRQIETAPEIPSLDEMARAAGLSTHHFHRLFKAITGVTPRAYATAHQARRLRAALVKPGTTITAALYDAGFNSSSRFYESSNALLGMTPTKYRDGGRDTEICFAMSGCSLGAILVARSERGVCAILMGDDQDALTHDLEKRFPRARLVRGGLGFEALVAKVVGFVEAPARGLDLPLDIRGTAFQQRVWQALCEIPAGSTASYLEIAKRIGAPKSVRAVAGACAANPLAVAIPCHRAVRSDGALSGYRWGVARKCALLDRERTR